MKELDKPRTAHFWNIGTGSEEERTYTDREVLEMMISDNYNSVSYEDILSAIGRALLESDSDSINELLVGLAELALSKESLEEEKLCERVFLNKRFGAFVIHVTKPNSIEAIERLDKLEYLGEL